MSFLTPFYIRRVSHRNPHRIEREEGWYQSNLAVMLNPSSLENNPKQIRTLIGLKPCFYRSFSLSRNKKINQKPFSGYSQEIVILLELNKEDTSPSLGLRVFPNRRYPWKCFAEIYRAQYGNAMLVHIRCAPTWRAENGANI